MIRLLLKESAIYGIAGIASRAVGLLLVPFYTRALTPSDYGVMDTIAVSVTLVGMVADFGVGSGVARYFYEETDDRQRSLAFIGFFPAFLTLIFGGILFAFRAQISRILFDDLAFTGVIVVASFTLPINFVWNYSLLLWRLKNSPRPYVGWSTINLLITVGITIYFVVVMRIGIIGVFWGKLAGSIVCAPIAMFIHRRHIKWQIIWGQVRAVFSYGMPIVPASMLRWAQRYADRYLLLALTGVEQVGLYVFGVRVSSLLLLVTAPLELAWTPFALSIAGKPGHKITYARVLSGYAALATLGIATLSFFSDDIVRLLAPASYWPARQVVGPLAGVVVLDTAFILVAIGVNLAKKTALNTIAFAIGTIVDLIGVILFTDRFGINAAAISWFVASLCSVGLVFWFSQRNYLIPYKKFGLVIAVVITVASILIGPALHQINWLVFQYFAKIILLIGVGFLTWVWILDTEFRAVIVDNAKKRYSTICK